MQTLSYLTLAALVFIAPAHPLQQAPQTSSNATSSETVEDVAVLQRLLKDAIEHSTDSGEQNQFSGSLRSGRSLAGLMNLSNIPMVRVESSRGFHLPGAGVIVTIDVDVPVSPRAQDQSAPEADPQQPDAWDRARRELSGDPMSSPPREKAGDDGAKAEDFFLAGALPQAMVTYRNTRWDLDERSIARTQEAVLDVLARYGKRVRGLASDETITVALYVSSTGDALPDSTVNAPRSNIPLYQFYAQQQSQPEASQELWKSWLRRYSAGEARAVHLVVQARVADLATSAVAADPPAKLRERATVHRY